jgi:hypothetical protein
MSQIANPHISSNPGIDKQFFNFYSEYTTIKLVHMIKEEARF